jgi:hypothetical protein
MSNFVDMPQDDGAQIDQIVVEYNGDPAKGLAHGVQKDAIQNGFGARKIAKEIEACKTWSFSFEIIKVQGKDALVFWDEGTFGLTGDLLSAEEITRRFAEGTLGPDERYARFMARFVSGGNIGAGMFGRGKLIFSGASVSRKILIDSLRDDGKYVAVRRYLEGGRLRQNNTPFQDTEAHNFIFTETGGKLKPLEMSGTRITILDVDPEVAQAVRYSFRAGSFYKASLAYMIEETWWEIIEKFEAKIFIIDGEKKIQVKVNEPLKTITSLLEENGIKIHHKTNLPVQIGNVQYRIKELKFVLMPSAIEEEFRDIWLQRKRMKVGSIAKYININSKISKRLAGYVILEPDLEEIVEKAEAPHHYSFKLSASGIKHIRDVVRREITEFERRLGLVETNAESTSRRQMLESLSAINQIATELGLPTQNGLGINKSKASILVKKIILPEEGNVRVEIGDEVGPITYEIINRSDYVLDGKFQVIMKQPGREEILLTETTLQVGTNDNEEILLPAFKLESGKFENHKSFLIYASFSNGQEILAESSRVLYLGLSPRENNQPIKLYVSYKFPKDSIRRVNISEVISKIFVRVQNTTASKLLLNLKTTVRHLENRKSGRPTVPLYTLFEEKSIELNAQEEREFELGSVSITLENFSGVIEAEPSIEERTCDIYTTVNLSEASVELNLTRHAKLESTSMRFYVEVDPPGNSVFSGQKEAIEPDAGWRSKKEMDANGGFIFVLNVAHPYYKLIKDKEDDRLLQLYIQEQMLMQAHLIAVEYDIFRGVSEEHKETFNDDDTPPTEIIRVFDIILGSSLTRLVS